MSEKIPIASYGIVRMDNLAWLHETPKGPGRCLMRGMEELESPFELVLPRPVRICPHKLPEPHAYPGTLPMDPVVEAMSVAPKRFPPFCWIEPSQADAVIEPAQHMVPRFGEPAAFLARELRHVQARLTLTNCLPLIMIGYSPEHWQMIAHLGRLARDRTLIVSGYPKIPEAVDITPSEVVKRTPEEWSMIASAQLFNWIEKESRHE